MEVAEDLVKVRSKDGTLIACWRGGRGPPLVLVHGSAADHKRWRPVLPALRENYTVYTVDRRGRGDSGDSETYAIEREFVDVASVVDSLGEPANLLGHSYGALCSLEAGLLTKNVRRLILYEPPIPVGLEIFSPGIIDRLQDLLNQGDRERELSRRFYVKSLRYGSRI